jgi:hypothetical protein
MKNRLQSWICRQWPWLSKGCWPAEEYREGEQGEPRAQTPAARFRAADAARQVQKAKFDRDAQDLARTLKIIDAKIDVIAGTDRLGAYGQRPKRVHERGG